jgi:hypothetical protein
MTDSRSAATRWDNTRSLLLLPVKLLALLASMACMVIGVLLVLPVVFLVLLPLEIVWAASLPVGVVSPSVGHRMASGMEVAGDLLDRATEAAFAPVDWIADRAGL